MNIPKSKLSLFILCCLVLTSGFTVHAEGAISNSSQANLKYLGDGYSTVKKGMVYGGMALEYPDGVQVVTEEINDAPEYGFIYSRQELQEKVAAHFSSELSESGSDVTTIANATNFVKNVDFPKDKITFIAYWKQVNQRVYTNGLPKLSDNALTMLKRDSKKFTVTYGDKYISGVALGKMFFLLYQIDSNNLSQNSKNEICRALELRFKKTIGVTISASEEVFINQKLNGVFISQISSTAYGINSYFPPNSFDEFNAMVHQPQNAVIEKTLTDYACTGNTNSFFDVSDYCNMATQWEQHISNLKYIIANQRISTALKSDCMKAYNSANEQLALVYALDNSARYPDLSTLHALYNYYIQEMVITQSDNDVIWLYLSKNGLLTTTSRLN